SLPMPDCATAIPVRIDSANATTKTFFIPALLVIRFVDRLRYAGQADLDAGLSGEPFPHSQIVEINWEQRSAGGVFGVYVG
ncbi:MAG: hypothetical protein ACLPSO_13420, partial [Terracidiphilus sp.]